jgi:F-type H+-transporting ATPase subunit beta
MTQQFFVAEGQRGSKGVYVPLGQTVEDVVAILKGQADRLDEQALRFIGVLSEAKDG